MSSAALALLVVAAGALGFVLGYALAHFIANKEITALQDEHIKTLRRIRKNIHLTGDKK